MFHPNVRGQRYINRHYSDSTGMMMFDVEPAHLTRSCMMTDQVLLNSISCQRRQNEAYEELKRLILFAGLFFLFMIIFVLLKFQISLDDIFKWSPVVWLIGVIICGLMMNAFLHVRRFFKKRRAKRLREQQNLLYSLNLPTSYPCLAPPPHEDHCCQFGPSFSAEFGSVEGSQEPLPSYDQAVITALRPPTWIPPVSLSRANPPNPPTYSTSCLNEEQPEDDLAEIRVNVPQPPILSRTSEDAAKPRVMTATVSIQRSDRDGPSSSRLDADQSEFAELNVAIEQVRRVSRARPTL